MNFKRIGRLLVCLVLICALLINVSPLKARALEPVSTVMVAAKYVIPAVVMGLGIYRLSSNPDAFDGLCNAIRDVWDAAGYIVNGMCTMFRLTNGYAIRSELLELSRDYLWDSGTISGSPDFFTSSDGLTALHMGNYYYFSSALTAGKWFYYTERSDGSYSFSYIFCVYNTDIIYRATTPDGDRAEQTSSFMSDGVKVYYCQSASSSIVSASNLQTRISEMTSAGYVLADYGTSVDSFYSSGQLQKPLSLSPGLRAGIIGALNLTLGLAYPNWQSQLLQDEDEEQLVYPLGFGQTLDETLGLTQEEIWAGLGTYEDLTEDQLQGQTLLQQLGYWFGQVLEILTSIPLQILNGLTQILIDVLTYLFVPAQDFLQLKIQALVQKFGYLEPIISLGDTFKVYLTGVNPTPPVIWIDLGASAWYPMGGRVKFIDLTWYAQYKSTVDGILGAFLWLWFLWRLFQIAPGIVRGASGMFGKPDSHPDSSFSTRSE